MAKIEASIEGPMDLPLSDGSGGVTVTAMGITVRFTPGDATLPPDAVPGTPPRMKSIKTPTRSRVPLTITEFLDQTPFPGRPGKRGFEGATIIAEGVFDTDNKVMDAEFINVEPSETVILGAITGNTPGTPRKITVNGVEVIMLTDTRLPANRKDKNGPPVFYNQYAFPMKDSSILVSPIGPDPLPPADPFPPSSVEGYFGTHPSDPNKGAFYAFLFEYGDTGELLDDSRTKPQISIERAPRIDDDGTSWQIRARGTLTADYLPGPKSPQALRFFAIVNNAPVALPASLQVDLDDIPGTPFMRWRLRDSFPKTPNFALAPEVIRVRNISAEQAVHIDVMDEFETDIR